MCKISFAKVGYLSQLCTKLQKLKYSSKRQMGKFEDFFKSANFDDMKIVTLDNYQKVLAEIIEEYLRESGDTKPEFAEKCGFSLKYLYDILNQEANVTMLVFLNILKQINDQNVVIREWKKK